MSRSIKVGKRKENERGRCFLQVAEGQHKALGWVSAEG